MLDISSVKKLIEEIKNERPKNDALPVVLESLDEILRNNKQARESIDELFYQAMLEKLNQLIVEEHETKWLTISLVIKCVKNSAAVFRLQFFDSERILCDFIYEKFVVHMLFEMSPGIEDLYKNNTFLYSMQYIFNLLQGNR